MCSMLRSPKILTATFFGLTHGKVRGDFWMPSCIQTGGLRGNRLYRAALVSLTACACAYYDFKIDAVFILFAICRFTRAARLRLASEHRPAPFFLLLIGCPGNDMRTVLIIDLLCVRFSPAALFGHPRKREQTVPISKAYCPLDS